MPLSERRKIQWGAAAPASTAAPQNTTAPPAALPQPVLDSLPVAQTRKRKREWERRNRGVTYRGVPRELLVQVQDVATGLNVVTDDVARSFLEYGLSAYQVGKLMFNPRPRGIRMTLYPQPGKQPNQRFAARKSKSKKGSSPAWESRATFRGFPPELQEGVRQAADDLCVPVGEVVVAFFRYAIDAYQDGLLALNPYPKTVTMTLFGD